MQEGVCHLGRTAPLPFQTALPLKIPIEALASVLTAHYLRLSFVPNLCPQLSPMQLMQLLPKQT